MDALLALRTQRHGDGPSRICVVVTRDRPDPEQMRILARLSPEQKLAIARRIREGALALKQAWLRQCHPDETDAAIRRRLRAWQLYGRAELD